MKEGNINNPFEYTDNPKSLEPVFRDKYFSHDSPDTYFKIASQAKLIEMSTPYSENLLDILETQEGVLTELGEMIAERIKNGVLVDLGCGSGFMREYAKLAGVKLYIGIDKSVGGSADRSDDDPPSRPGKLKTRVLNMTSEEVDMELENLDDDDTEQEIESTQHSQKTNQKKYEISEELKINLCNEKEILVESDMLIALSRLPDKSVAAIIASGIEYDVVKGDENELYNKALQREIQRVLIDKGIFLGYYTDIQPSASDRFSRIGPPKKDWSFNILEKIPEKQN